MTSAKRGWAALLLSFLVVAPATADTLSGAVRHALTTNPVVQSRSANMKATAYELMQLRGEFLPTVDIYADIGREKIDDPASLTPAENNQTKTRELAGMRARYVLFDGHRRANLVYANAARVDASIFNLLDASETMALNAVEAYIDVYRHQALLGVARRNIDTHVQIGRQVRDLVNAGRLPFSDELTIDDRIAAARLAELDVQRSLKDAVARYERVVGRAPSGPMRLTDVPVPSSLDQFRKTALSDSYRLKQSQARLDQTIHQREVAMSDRLPTFALEAGISTGENQNGNFGARDDQYVALSMNWTIYRGGRLDERNALAQRIHEVAYQREAVVRDVVELAERTWAALQVNTERAQRLGQQLAVNRTLVSVYSEEFEAAKRTLLDLLEVERSRFNVEFEKVSSDASLAFTRYRILATQSKLAAHFGIAPTDTALVPSFQRRALAQPKSVFNTVVEPLE